MAFHVSKTSILSTLDYIEDGRADIYKWGETRRSQRKGIRGKLYQFKKLFIDKSVRRYFYLFIVTVIRFSINQGYRNLSLDTFFIKLLKTCFNLQILRSFVHNLTLMVFLQMGLAGEDKS